MKTIMVLLSIVLTLCSNVKAEELVAVKKSQNGSVESYQILSTKLFTNDMNGSMLLSAACNVAEDSAIIYFHCAQSNILDSMAVCVDKYIIRGEMKMLAYNQKYGVYCYSFRMPMEDSWRVFDGVERPRIILCSNRRAFTYKCKNMAWKQLMPQIAQTVQSIISEDQRYAAKR